MSNRLRSTSNRPSTRTRSGQFPTTSAPSSDESDGETPARNLRSRPKATPSKSKNGKNRRKVAVRSYEEDKTSEEKSEESEKDEPVTKKSRALASTNARERARQTNLPRKAPAPKPWQIAAIAAENDEEEDKDESSSSESDDSDSDAYIPGGERKKTTRRKQRQENTETNTDAEDSSAEDTPAQDASLTSEAGSTSTNTPKKRYSCFTQEKIKFLEEKYAENPFPPLAQRKAWAAEMEVPASRLQIWFSVRRNKETEMPEPDAEQILERILARHPNFKDYQNQNLWHELHWPMMKVKAWFDSVRDPDMKPLRLDNPLRQRAQKEIADERYQRLELCFAEYPFLHSEEMPRGMVQYIGISAGRIIDSVTLQRESEAKKLDAGFRTLENLPETMQALEIALSQNEIDLEFLETATDVPVRHIRAYFEFRKQWRVEWAALGHEIKPHLREPIVLSDPDEAALVQHYCADLMPNRKTIEEWGQEVGLQYIDVFSWVIEKKQSEQPEPLSEELAAPLFVVQLQSNPFFVDYSDKRLRYLTNWSAAQIRAWFEENAVKELERLKMLTVPIPERDRLLRLFHLHPFLPEREAVRLAQLGIDIARLRPLFNYFRRIHAEMYSTNKTPVPVFPLNVLDREFKLSPFTTNDRIRHVCVKTRLSETQVREWSEMRREVQKNTIYDIQHLTMSINEPFDINGPLHDRDIVSILTRENCLILSPNENGFVGAPGIEQRSRVQLNERRRQTFGNWFADTYLPYNQSVDFRNWTHFQVLEWACQFLSFHTLRVFRSERMMGYTLPKIRRENPIHRYRLSNQEIDKIQASLEEMDEYVNEQRSQKAQRRRNQHHILH